MFKGRRIPLTIYNQGGQSLARAAMALPILFSSQICALSSLVPSPDSHPEAAADIFDETGSSITEFSNPPTLLPRAAQDKVPAGQPLLDCGG
jgi:hypothetical protein